MPLKVDDPVQSSGKSQHMAADRIASTLSVRQMSLSGWLGSHVHIVRLFEGALV